MHIRKNVITFKVSKNKTEVTDQLLHKWGVNTLLILLPASDSTFQWFVPV